VERTQYVVPSWGVGELWTSADVVVAHEFDFEVAVDDEVLEPAHQAEPDSGVATDVIARVRSHLAGDDISFAHVALDLDWCTPFQREVLSVLRSIPRGEVVSYGELAALAGRPGAQRAVGSICAGNRYAFFVPCHRAVAANGIGGYGSAGVAVKRRLLALEGVSL
jgi:methylated-DNA-[protein]-cysteine S-methyltransferase